MATTSTSHIKENLEFVKAKIIAASQRRGTEARTCFLKKKTDECLWSMKDLKNCFSYR